VCERAGFLRDNKLPRAKQTMVSDAIGIVAGAALGTSTFTSFIESAALTIVGTMMMQNVAKITPNRSRHS
jgi:AGZA family xanthine/uracil permease-like MFS transporter